MPNKTQEHFTKKHLFIIIIFSVLLLFISANISQNFVYSSSAAKTKEETQIVPKLTQPIPGLELTEEDVIYERDVIKVYWLAKYIKAIYHYGIYLVGVLALIMLMIGGLLWVSAGGTPDRINQAKKIIGGAITGLILGLCSYLLLLTINPALVELRPIELKIIEPIKCTIESYDKKKCEEFCGKDQVASNEYIVKSGNDLIGGHYCCKCKISQLCEGEKDKEKCSTDGSRICYNGACVVADELCANRTERCGIGYLSCCDPLICFDYRGECGECRKLDESCAMPSDCCHGLKCVYSSTVKQKICTLPPPPCSQTGQACTYDFDCCSGLICRSFDHTCNSPLPLTPPCSQTGQACTSTTDCCSDLICRSDFTCNYCSWSMSICYADSDCCSGRCDEKNSKCE